jgi:hypothetical protein
VETVADDVPRTDLAHDEELVRDFAVTVLEHAAPEELALFEDSAADYFRDPESVLAPARRDEAVGFGLDLALLTPYVLAVAGPILTFLVQTVGGVVKDESEPAVRRWVRRLLGRDDDQPVRGAAATPEPPATLTADQAERVREIAWARATDLGLPEGQARLLADSVVGGLVATGS